MDCSKIVERYLLNKNPLYAFSFPISILFSIVVFGMSQAFRWSENSYINQILIPVSVLLLSMVILDMISRAMLSKSEMDKYMKLCKLWLSNPIVKSNPFLSEMLDLDVLTTYNGDIENFIQNGNEQYVDELEINPLAPHDEDALDGDEIQDSDDDTDDDMERSASRGEPQSNDEKSVFSPFPLSDVKPDSPYCLEGTTDCNLCSGYSKPQKTSPIPGPQWIPQNAKTVQKRLAEGKYTASQCKM
jgi:hypothetical protein